MGEKVGTESWAYIPAELLPSLHLLAHKKYNSSLRRSYVDGAILVADIFYNNDWRTIAAFGLRTGGSSYTVLDITDRLNPSLIGEVSDPAKLGQSWHKPAVVKAGTSAEGKPSSLNWKLVVGSNRGRSDLDTYLGVIDLESTLTLSTVKILGTSGESESLESEDKTDGTFVGGIAVVDADNSIGTDRLYFGTSQGNLYGVATPANPSNWATRLVFAGDKNRPITARPTAVLAEDPHSFEASELRPAVAVYFGTGRYDTLADGKEFSAYEHRIYGLFEPLNIDSKGEDDTQKRPTTTLTDKDLIK